MTEREAQIMTMTPTQPRPSRSRRKAAVPEPETLYTTQQVLAACPGLSFRMLDWWLRTGAVSIAAGALPGSGRSRLWSDAELAAVLNLFARYQRAKAEIAAIRSGRAWQEELAEMTATASIAS